MKVKTMFINKHRLSIRKRIVISFAVVILILSIINIVTIVKARIYSKEYDKIVSEIAMINEVNQDTKTKIDATTENIVAGMIDFDEGDQYIVIENAKSTVNTLLEGETDREKVAQLEVAMRTIDTLTKYIDQLGEQINNEEKVSKNQEVLINIRGITELLQEVIREFILYELKTCDELNTEIQKSFDEWFNTCLLGLVAVVIFSVLAIWMISGSISKPIRKICQTTSDIANGNFDIKLEDNNRNELDILAKSINLMSVKVKDLLNKSVKEQENIKKSELKVLQAQINPHFLYNTLDTIVWTAEAKNTEQVIDIVKALSGFFRIALSDGKEWISAKEEIEHVNNYLRIQKIRYRDILRYRIDTDENILKCSMLKLTLQPLVENALYHGIKSKRYGGLIQVNGYKKNEKEIVFEVKDNGIGMKKDRLDFLQSEIKSANIYEAPENSNGRESGFGLKNIQKRIVLYYGEGYGMEIESEYNVGTKIILTIPIKGVT
jgi:two-component system sensor histidine kinase YesM